MLRTSSSSSTAVYDATPPRSDTSDSSDSDDVDYTPIKFNPPRAKSCAFILTPTIDVARLMKTHLETVRPTDNGDRRDWAQFISRQVTTQEKSSCVLSSLLSSPYLGGSRVVHPVSSPTLVPTLPTGLLHVVYLLVGAQYNGQYTMLQYRRYWNDDDFMMFSPLGPSYFQPGTPGSYVSTTEDLHAFSSHTVDLDTLESTFMTTTTHQLPNLALLFDFMAFTAQTFRRVLGSKMSSAANLKAIRDIMIENLSTMDATFDNDLTP
jgi:hypothetical protein